MIKAKTISAAIIGTSAMTLYSYVLAGTKNRNFREPENLSILLRRLAPVEEKEADVICWTAHYTVGLLFVLVYEQLYANTQLKPNIRTGLTLGFFTGLFAILVWKMVFHLHPRPPKKDFKRYYGQLLIAHIIFGLVSTLVCKKGETTKQISN
ncbi:MAG TPA: hypothetical protein VEB40_16525 [Flavipsychrobacter sp.]|nr:hypothetical protein [Flavipsychrobacter sp.]